MFSLFEQDAQREEAYARATVALTRAQQICMIMGPLDMRGLVGAATIVGCLKYGACFSGRDLENRQQLILQLKDDNLLEAPNDSDFLRSVRISCSKKNGVYPLALVEAYKTEDDPNPRVRRLHLIIVDLKRRKRLSNGVGRRFRRMDVWQDSRHCLNTLPVACKSDLNDYQLRYAFGYAMDGEDLPCYLIWPKRTEDDNLWLVDAWQDEWIQLDRCNFLAPMGIEHFFEGFALKPTRPWKSAAGRALGLNEGQITDDARILSPSAEQYELAPRVIPGQGWDAPDPVKEDVPMQAKDESDEGEQSGWSSLSNSTETDSDETLPDDDSVVSDQDRLEAAYETFSHLHEGLHSIDTPRKARKITSDDAQGVPLPGGPAQLQEMVHLPRNWPLARLMIPLEGLCQQVDRLLEGYCSQIAVTNVTPGFHHGKVVQAAKYLTLQMAEYLADTIAWLMRSILEHETKILFDTDTEPLMSPGFWIVPLYRELLNSASRHRPSPASERARGCSGLVKIVCKETQEHKSKRKHHDGTSHPKDKGGFEQWFGSTSLIATLYVWFPASWAPLVADRLFEKSLRRSPPTDDARSGQPASGLTHTPRGSQQSLPDVRDAYMEPAGTGSYEVQYKVRKWSREGEAMVPVLHVTSRVNWLQLDDSTFLSGLEVLREGILCDVFSQKCSAAWQGARPQRLMVSIMLPGRQSPDEWHDFMLSQRNLWPTLNSKGGPGEELSERTFRRERRKLQAKHLWMNINVQFHMLDERIYTKAATGKSRQELEDLLFCKGSKERNANPYEQKAYCGPYQREVEYNWQQCKEWMMRYKTHIVPFDMPFHALIQALRGKQLEARQQVDYFMHYCAKRWQTKEGTYQIKKRKLDVRDLDSTAMMVDMADL